MLSISLSPSPLPKLSLSSPRLPSQLQLSPSKTQTKKSLILLTTIAILTIHLPHKSEAVICYQCNSNEPECILPTGCGTVCEGEYCYKLESKLKGQRLVARGCDERGRFKECHDRLIYSCSCQSYLCNADFFCFGEICTHYSVDDVHLSFRYTTPPSLASSLNWSHGVLVLVAVVTSVALVTYYGF